jgi:hypothetical protein
MKRGTAATATIGSMALVVSLACGRSEPAPASAPAPAATPQSAPESASQTSKSGQPAPPPTATAVNFEELVALLPEATGWTRGKPRGEQVSMGVTMSQAKAEYEKGDASIDLQITDSSFNQLVLTPFTMFLKAGFSERSNEGYTKSVPVAGNPGFEKWNGESRRAEVTVVVGNRFIVQGTGHNVENVDAVRALVQSVDLGKLASLK